MLIPSERKVIEEAFLCKVTDLYGCEEVGLIASECEMHNGMHINMENNYVEFVDYQGNHVLPGQEGAIVVTSLLNRAMPIIRYKIEDIGILSERICSCGRHLPLLEKVRGRVADFLVRKDSSLVAGVSLVERTLTAIPGIDQMQIIQEDMDNITLTLVKNERFTEETQRELEKEFRGVFGTEMAIHFHYVPSIPPEHNGKYRFSISKVKSIYCNA
jgi:phenylacetate-CoA ligase